MQGQSNPEFVPLRPFLSESQNNRVDSVTYQQVTCPAAIVARSGCSVSGYTAPRAADMDTSPETETETASIPSTTTITAPTQTTLTTSTQKASAPASLGEGGDDEECEA